MDFKLKPIIIPFFISHEGCPHRCVFCNQQVITGVSGTGGLSGVTVVDQVRSRLAELNEVSPARIQVAFYGGSFTCLSFERQRELLGAVRPFMDSGQVASIRISTRPDAIDQARMDLLAKSGVTTVELGIQSLDDQVLAESGRGHTTADSIKAVRTLKDAGFQVGGQLMIGLPGEGFARLYRGARQLADLRPDFVRLYPVLVLGGSRLAVLYREQRYRPWSLVRAVIGCGWLKQLFDAQGIRVIRMGLQAASGLEDELVAGPYHPAFGELVLSRNLLKRVRIALRRYRNSGAKTLAIAACDESVFRGADNINLLRLRRLGLLEGVEVVFRQDLTRNQFMISPVDERGYPISSPP
ncbi:MAG: radical SAM protein [Proteobacteria bacterium]|nr:radical SAM protein [Pseudomonadota bacterium]MBU1685832.1 radical SAM protein [Pseudomonadota bacterium]